MASRLFKTAMVILISLAGICYPLAVHSPYWAELGAFWQRRVVQAWNHEIVLCVMFWFFWWARESVDELLESSQWGVRPARRSFRASPAALFCVLSLAVAFAVVPLDSILLAGLLYPTGASVLLIMGGSHA